MSWLDEQIAKATKEARNPQGIYLLGDANGMAWEITAPPSRNYSRFLLGLDQILPSGSNLYFEGTSIDEDVIAFYRARQASRTTQVITNTAWPKPLYFHIPMTGDNLRDLADLFKSHSEFGICDHFHGYHEKELLLDWCDAFSKYPIYLSRRITEARVKLFCETIGSSYQLGQIGPEKK